MDLRASPGMAAAPSRFAAGYGPILGYVLALTRLVPPDWVHRRKVPSFTNTSARIR
jgi:hypothetical protein